MARDGTLRIVEAHDIAKGTDHLYSLVWHTIDISSGITTASVSKHLWEASQRMEV